MQAKKGRKEVNKDEKSKESELRNGKRRGKSSIKMTSGREDYGVMKRKDIRQFCIVMDNDDINKW